MADTATLQARLAEAEAALHKLLLGQSEITIAYDGKSVTYTRAEQSALRAYILELKNQLGTGRRKALSIGF